MILLEKNGGFSLVELLVVLAIFSVILAVVFSSYITQVKHTGREYRVAEAEMEVGIARGIIERDMAMAGYGIAEDYSAATLPAFTAPRVASATNGGPDTLTLTGTALGMDSKQAQAWTYIDAAAPTFKLDWGDSRENLEANDRIVLMEPGSKKLLAEGGKWLFNYDGSNGTPGNRLTTLDGGTSYSTPTVGTLVYGLCGSSNTSCNAAGIAQPYYAVRYYLGGAAPSNCASGTQSLLRAESRTSASPVGGDSIMDCVLDMEIAFGLDTNEDGTIDTWDEGGVTAGSYDVDSLRKRLKQIRMYILMQSGNLDPDYTSPSSIRVGDSLLGTGRDVDMTTVAQRQNYRWRVLSITATPRNIR